jgi:integrase
MPQTGLLKRNSTYYVNIRVPGDIASHYGRTHLKASLRTKDRREAVSRVREELARLEQEFAGIRKRAQQSAVLDELRIRHRITSLDDETIGAIAATLLEENLEADDHMRSLGVVGDMEETNQQLLTVLQPAYARGDIAPIEPLATQLIAMMGIELSVSDADWRRLCMKLLEASLQATQIQAKRLVGEVIPTTTIMATAPKRLTLGRARDGNGPSLTQVLERWKAVADRRPRTVAEMSSLVRRFEEYSDKPVNSLVRQDGIGYRDLMRELGAAPGTVKKNLGLITSLLNFAVDEGLISANPFARIKVPLSKAVERLEYSIEDIAKIFGSALFVDGERPRGGGGEAAVWLPLIGAYTGARLEEIAQLRPADLFHDKDYGWCFSILDLDDNQHLKTESSRRRIPVHPALIAAGLIEYRAHVLDDHQQWLFPDLTPHVNGTRSGNWSKWWGRYARATIGITDKRKVYHSWRHAFKTACRGAQIPEEVHDFLTGHASASIGRNYGQQPLGVLRHAIDKFSYRGITPPSSLWPPAEKASGGAASVTKAPSAVNRKKSRRQDAP